MRRVLISVIAGILLLLGAASVATAADRDDERAGRYVVMVSLEGYGRLWEAPYERLLPSGAGWTDGDRAGYRCQYGFLEYRDRLVGRFTFTQVRDPADPRARETAYATVIDDGMKEGVRYYDGTLAPPEAGIELGDCPLPTIPYEPYFGPDQRPIITFETTRGRVLETRSYVDLIAHEAVVFRLLESSSQRATVVAYVENLPQMVVYYDSMDPKVIINSVLE